MADSIRIKRGVKADLPKALPLGELAYCTDTRQLFIGTGNSIAPVKAEEIHFDDLNERLEGNSQNINKLYKDVDSKINTINNNISLLQEKTEDVTTQLNEKANINEILTSENTSDLYLANFFDTHVPPQLTYLYVTNDGINFYKLSDKDIGNVRDCDIIFYNDKFYCITTQSTGSDICDFRMLTSENLSDWTTHKIDVGLRSEELPYVWAPDWFFDDDGKLYITISKQVGTMVDSVDGKTYKSFRPYIVEVKDLENKIFGVPKELKLNDYNYIDVHMQKKDGKYYLFIKKERTEGSKINGNIEIWTSNDMQNWSNYTYGISSLIGATVEGPMISYINNKYYLYVDNYNGEIGGNMVYCTSDDLLTWSSPKSINAGYTTRHGSVRKITDVKGKKIIYNKINEWNVTNHLENKSRQVINSTSHVINKYIELYKFSVKDNYKALSMVFNVSDAQNNFINADLKLSIRKGSSNSNVTIDFKILNQYVPHDYVEKFSIVNHGNGTFSLIYKVGTLSSVTPIINVLSLSNYAFSVIESNNVMNELPVGTEIKPTIYMPSYFHSYRDSKNFQTLKNKSITLQFYGINGVAEIKGHTNGYLENQIIDYKLMLLNGNIGLIKNNANGSTITVTKNSYSGGIYNLTITVPNEYSIFDITIPTGSYFIN